MKNKNQKIFFSKPNGKQKSNIIFGNKILI